MLLSHTKAGLSTKGLAIIDDQSTSSFVVPYIAKEVNIPKEDLTPDVLMTSTVNGILKSETIIIKNLLITPLNGDSSVPLDCARTCYLPDVLNDVPTLQEVLSIPGLSHLSEKFPAKEDWPTLMLIGMDCAQAQKHIQTVSSEDEHQLAIQTPLGWMIMGKPAHTTRPLPMSPPHISSTSYEDNASQASASAPTSTLKPSYASVLETQAEDNINSEPCAQHYLQDDEQTALVIQGTKEEELPGYFNEELAFLNHVVPNVPVRPDCMIELPLPFREANLSFQQNSRS